MRDREDDDCGHDIEPFVLSRHDLDTVDVLTHLLLIIDL